jgi:predicted RNA-binding Zn ribbon-like protein
LTVSSITAIIIFVGYRSEGVSTTAQDLIGGALCLDFANSGDDNGVDHLGRPGDVIAWAEYAGALHERIAQRCRGELAVDSSIGERLLADAQGLRQAIRSIMAGIAEGQAPESRALGVLKSHARRAVAGAELAQTGIGYDFDFSGSTPDVVILGPVVRSALDLLRDGQFQRVKRCPSCGWLFYDQSKNNSRRWCDMATCGNATKVRRHRRRAADKSVD